MTTPGQKTPATSELPEARNAQVHVLFTGYAGDRVAGTISFIRDGHARIVVDPGMVPNTRAILDPLAALGESYGSITDVILTHHHPDHTLHAGLFPNARVHDFWAIYQGDIWKSRDAEGAQVSPSVRLLKTPGHSPQDITILAGTPEGIVAFTHLWWTPTGPAEDPRATDMAQVHAGRERVLRLANQIVPGHGAPFTPGPETPR